MLNKVHTHCKNIVIGAAKLVIDKLIEIEKTQADTLEVIATTTEVSTNNSTYIAEIMFERNTVQESGDTGFYTLPGAIPIKCVDIELHLINKETSLRTIAKFSSSAKRMTTSFDGLFTLTDFDDLKAAYEELESALSSGLPGNVITATAEELTNPEVINYYL